MAKDRTILPPVNLDDVDAELRQLLKDAGTAHDEFDSSTTKLAERLEHEIDKEAAAMIKTDKSIAADITAGLEEVSKAQAKINIPESK